MTKTTLDVRNWLLGLHGRVEAIPRLLRIAIVLLTGLFLLYFGLVHAHQGSNLAAALFMALVVMGVAILFRYLALLTIPFCLVGYHMQQSTLMRDDLVPVLVNDAMLFFALPLVVAAVSEVTGGFVQQSRYLAMISKDLQLANRIQKNLMRKSFENERVEVAGYLWQHLEVGGDFYMFRLLNDDLLAFCIGDVMGRGIAAALMMCMGQIFVSEEARRVVTPAKALHRLNNNLLEYVGENIFITMFYGLVDLSRIALYFSKAGHCDGFLISVAGEVERLYADGIPLGIFADQDFEEKKVNVEPGAKIVLHTDGLMETRNSQGEFMAEEDLCRFLSDNRALAPAELIKALVAEVEAFAQGSPLNDDMAVLVIHVKG